MSKLKVNSIEDLDGNNNSLVSDIKSVSQKQSILDWYNTGDIFYTTRDDVDLTKALEILETDEVYDKVDYPDLWGYLKVYLENDVIVNPDTEGEFFMANQDSIKFGTINHNVEACYLFNGKWIRVLNYRDQTNGTYHFLTQVSDDFSFNSFREYPIQTDNVSAAAQSICFIPELNKILYTDNESMVILDVTDADDLDLYADSNYGGQGTAPTKLSTPWTGSARKIFLSNDPNESDCMLCVHDESFNIYVNDVSNIDDFFTNAIQITQTQIENDGYSPLSFSSVNGLMSSSRKVYFWDQNLLQLISKNVDNSTYNVEVDLSTETINSAAPAQCSYDGSVWLRTNAGHYVLNKEKGETQLKPISKINPNTSDYNFYIFQYIPSLSFMIARLTDTTGLSGDLNKKEFWRSFDDGQNWELLIPESDQTGVDVALSFDYSNLMNNNGSRKTGADKDVITEPSADWFSIDGVGDRSGNVMLLKIQEEGYSDLFTVQGITTNGQSKPFIKT